MSGIWSAGERRPASPGKEDAFAAAVREARAEIAASVEQGGLRRDPLRHPLGALSTVVGLFPELVVRLEAMVERARAPWTEDERRAAVRDAVARMDTRLVHRMVQFNRWAVILAALLAMAFTGAAWGGGYWWGYRAAENALMSVPAALGEALTGRDAAVWLTLIRENDLGRVRRACAVDKGRTACSFALWTEPVPPPRPGETR